MIRPQKRDSYKEQQEKETRFLYSITGELARIRLLFLLPAPDGCSRCFPILPVLFPVWVWALLRNLHRGYFLEAAKAVCLHEPVGDGVQVVVHVKRALHI